MNRKAIVRTLLVPALGLGLLTAAWSGPAGKKQPAAPAAESRVLGHLQLRGKRVTIKSGGRFTVRSRDGKVLAEDVTLQQLRAIDPALQEKLERTMAGGPPGVGWAGL